MKYLISHQIRVLADCFSNYNEVWDIVPAMMRFSFENPRLGVTELGAKSQLDKFKTLFNNLIGYIEKGQENEMILKRPHKSFKMADSLLEYFNKLDGGSEKTKENAENELLDIVRILHKKASALLKKGTFGIDLDIMDKIIVIMKRFTFDTATDIRDLIDRKKELKQELQKGPGRTAKREIKVYLDMDSCITDFDKAVKKLGPKAVKGLVDGASEEEKQYMYDKIESKGSEFWSEMEWYPKGDELWKIVKKFNPVLLSSPGLFQYAQGGKQDWVNAHLPGISLFLDMDKYEYAEPDSVLIDDSKPNIESWRDAGGIGIHYQGDPESVEKELKKIVSQV